MPLAATPARPLRARPELCPAPAEVSRVRGHRTSVPRRLSFFVPALASCLSAFCSPGAGCVRHPKVMRAHESFAPTRSARTPLVTTSPRHRLEADATRRERLRAEAMQIANDGNDAAARTFALAKKLRLAGPRASRFRGPPAASSSTLPPFDGLEWEQATNRDGMLNHPLTRIAQRRSARLETMAACATRPSGPRAASPDAPRRAARSAAPEVPSIDEPPSATTSGSRPALCLWWGLIHRLSPACG